LPGGAAFVLRSGQISGQTSVSIIVQNADGSLDILALRVVGNLISKRADASAAVQYQFDPVKGSATGEPSSVSAGGCPVHGERGASISIRQAPTHHPWAIGMLVEDPDGNVLSLRVRTSLNFAGRYLASCGPMRLRSSVTAGRYP
jgi:hypothetical protein